ncbi:MAG TPA: hypothetical protein VN874_01275 [Myxococcales bacterium]|nr:hypothetical protein [Myxococcales bacterium]
MKRMRGNMKATKALASLGALAALAGGGGAMSGCGASATLDPLARAAEVTSQQSGARISLSMKFSAPGLSGGNSIAMSAEGYFDERKRAGVMTMDLSGIPGISALPGGGSSIKMIFLYPVIYMNMPFLAGKLPAGKTWMKLDISKAAAAAGLGTSQLGSLEQDDPTKFLDYLRASSGAVTNLGSQSIDGVPTTHYSATLQMSRILDRLPGAQQAAAKAALEKLGSAGAIPVEVWVDAQGRVRRMQMSLSGLAGSSGPAVAAGIGGSITIDFTSYGPVPAVVAPPASEVFDMSGMLKNGAAGLGN